MSIPILPLAEWPEGINQASIPANDNANRLGVLNGQVISKAVTAQPGSPTDGDTYIIAATHTGAQWAAFSTDDLVIYRGGTWHAFAPIDGIVVNFAGHQEQFSGSSGWGTVDGGGAVSSVNTQTGVVVLDSDDIAEGSANLYATNERIDDRVAALLVAGTDITLTYNDGANTLTVAASGGGGGTVTSVDASGGLETVSGSAITVSGTIRVSRLVNAQTGTTYTYVTGDRGKLVTHSNASAIAGTLPQATGTFPVGWTMTVKNKGAGTLTITPTTSTIDGAATLVLTTGQWADITSDGTNYQAAVYAPSAGGSLTGFTSALNTSSPNNSTNASSLIPSGGTTNQDGVYGQAGTGAIQAQVADNGIPGGNKRGIRAVDWQAVRSNATRVASGSNSTISGGIDNTASSPYAFVGGGDLNNASASRAAILGGGSNLASGAASAIAGGESGTASGLNSFVGGGTSGTASGSYSAAFGYATTASGAHSTAFGRFSTTRGLYGAVANASGNFSATGDAQRTDFVHRITTTNATGTGLSADASAPAAATAVVLPNNSAYAFEAMVVGKVATFGDRAAFRITGMVSRGANAAATQIDGAVTVTALAQIGGASAWSATAVANTTLGSLEIQVTGAASTTIKWVASIKTTEVVG